MMKNSRPAKTKQPPLKIVGHRGAKALAPENTLASLRKALEHNVDEIEIDVRVTKDGVVILHHDQHLKDPSGSRFDVRQHTFAELQMHKANLTTLEAALRCIDRSVPLQIEVKSGEPTAPIVHVIQSFVKKGWNTSEDILFGSKSQQILRELQTTFPDTPLVIIESHSGVKATWRARQLRTKRISMNHRWFWSGFIRSMSRHGYELYAYTLDDPKRAKHWLSYGLAGVITDQPDRFEQRSS